MTNPSQLKYLDAIGIPVWVSRDRMLEDVAQPPLDNSTDTVTNNKTPVENTTSAVEGILQGLEEQTKKAMVEATKSQEPQEITGENSSQPTTLVEQQANEIARTSSHIVYARGSLQADWLVIGESPDANESHTDQPYAGESGILLNNMLRAVGLANPAEDAYAINILKLAREKPSANVISELNQLLDEKIKAIKPKIILLVGQLAAQNILKSSEPLARLRGKLQKHEATDANIIVTYYPSYLLSKPMDKRKAWDDLKLAMRLQD